MVIFQKSHQKATYLATRKKPNSPSSKGDDGRITAQFSPLYKVRGRSFLLTLMNLYHTYKSCPRSPASQPCKFSMSCSVIAFPLVFFISYFTLLRMGRFASLVDTLKKREAFKAMYNYERPDLRGALNQKRQHQHLSFGVL